MNKCSYCLREFLSGEDLGRHLNEEHFEELLALLPKYICKKIEVQEDDCWYSNGWHNSAGYAMVRFEEKVRPLHRVVRYKIKGDIPLDLTPDSILDHGSYCGKRRCIFPWHTKAGTYKDNAATSNSPTHVTARTNICKNGHDLSDEKNVYTQSRGGRGCKICDSKRHKEYYRENKERIVEYMKEYQEENKESLTEQRCRRYQENRESVAVYNKIQREKRKVGKKVVRGEISHEEAKAQLAKLLGVECS